MPMGLGTRAHELALVRRLRESLRDGLRLSGTLQGQKEFDFIKRVPATWDEVRVPERAAPCDYITVARRSGKDWYVGSLTNWDARTVKVPLDFLGAGKYVAVIYADAPDSAMDATHTTLTRQTVDRTTVLDIHMVSGGGNAIWIHPARP